MGQFSTLGLFAIYVFRAQILRSCKRVKAMVPSLGVRSDQGSPGQATCGPGGCEDVWLPVTQFLERNFEWLVDRQEWRGRERPGQLGPPASGRFSNDISSLNTVYCSVLLSSKLPERTFSCLWLRLVFHLKCWPWQNGAILLN